MICFLAISVPYSVVDHLQLLVILRSSFLSIDLGSSLPNIELPASHLCFKGPRSHKSTSSKSRTWPSFFLSIFRPKERCFFHSPSQTLSLVNRKLILASYKFALIQSSMPQYPPSHFKSSFGLILRPFCPSLNKEKHLAHFCNKSELKIYRFLNLVYPTTKGILEIHPHKLPFASLSPRLKLVEPGHGSTTLSVWGTTRFCPRLYPLSKSPYTIVSSPATLILSLRQLPFHSISYN